MVGAGAGCGMKKHKPDRLDRHLAAQVLADAHIYNDKRAAQKHGVTERTIRNYRKRAQTDAELSAIFLEMVERATARWANGISRAIMRMMNFAERAADEADPRIPENIEAVGGLMKTLIEAQLAVDVLRVTGGDDVGDGERRPAQNEAGAGVQNHGSNGQG
jgi:hypothetical protein